MSRRLEKLPDPRRTYRLKDKPISEQSPLDKYGSAMSELVDIKGTIVSEVGKIKKAVRPTSRTKTGGIDQLFPALGKLHDLIQTLPAILEEVGNDSGLSS